ncbi:MAG: hypothetical protein KDI38_14815 [Calditrichaeota bacterium]|nr:hypothetical protein [Calditrichota bacterium]
MNVRFLTCLCILLIGTSLWAQSGRQNPHGDIKWDCQDCHSTEAWHQMRSPLPFRHEETGFSLIGEHKFIDCASCHTSLTFARVATACADCHSDVHRGEFGNDCQSCHTPAGWQDQQAILEIHASRGFPLSGVHAVADCQACHVREQQNEFTMTGVNCYDCHLSDFALSLNPNHAQASFSLDCQNCHVPSAVRWIAPEYAHTEKFELRGAHLQTDCNSCHTSSYVGTPGECFSCHADAYNATTSPEHAVLGFSTNCAVCHNEVRWEDAVFDHLGESGFALNGAHAEAVCISCHVDNQFSGLPRDCYGCHQSDYQATISPNHVSGDFPTDCSMCHSEASWSPATFDHNLTDFPLTGAHQTVGCEDCHDGGQFVAIPTDCFSCHEGDYNGVSDPNHVANNFSQDCTECHNTAAWSPAVFDHNNTAFPLTGAHVSVNCLDCHGGGYSGTPAECFACHQDDYNSTNDPNHQAAGFPTECESCHSTANWEDTTWDHDGQYFPIYSGEHRNEWDTCADCHVQAGNYNVFECIFCHAHNENEMNSEHDDVSNYVYLSSACFDCHPDGRERPMVNPFQKLDRVR